jgi:hypothetical protein
MRKIITLLLTFSAYSAVNAQVTVTDFESFTLSPNSAYSPTTSASFQTPSASFQYVYNSNFQLWAGGFAYTNINDSVTGNFSNLYGVRVLRGYTNSAIYVVGQDRAVIKTTAVPQTTVAGFYITNTTYAYKSMAKGDAFARKFGDTTGTRSGTTIPQGSYPDYFKVIVKGYKNGAMKNDSVTAMLADFTFTNNSLDYILSSWKFVNTASIGEVDSIQFFMRSSDMSFGFINTPTFFAIDNFATGKINFTGTEKYNEDELAAAIYPNPFQSWLTIKLHSFFDTPAAMKLIDLDGNIIITTSLIRTETTFNLDDLSSGIYILEISSGDKKITKKIIKS